MLRSNAAAHAALLAGAFASFDARAQSCSGPIARTDVVACALAASLDVKIADKELAAIAGQRVAAGRWLPSNPIVGLSAAGRSVPQPIGRWFFNWYVTLSQEIEIAGQRGARLDVVDAEAAAQVRRVAVLRREVAADALAAYFEVLAGHANLQLADEIAAVASSLATFTEERTRAQLVAPLDLDLVRAEAVRLALIRQDTERRLASARTLLALLLGRDPIVPIEVGGVLDVDAPLPSQPEAIEKLVERALTLRGELAAAEMERRALDHRLRLFKRLRAPNLTLSAFVQNDAADEQVYGGGLSMPIPLPAPVGQTYRGEILETSARIEQASTSVELVRRRVRQEVAHALAVERSRAAALQLFSPELLQRAHSDLAALREALAARQLSVREALLAQRSLIELLIGHVDARLGYALAWIELRRAAGLPLDGGVL